MLRKLLRHVPPALPGLAVAMALAVAPAGASTYYVSSSAGSDANDGLSEASPLQTVGRVNALDLAPDDRVLFRCGDSWRREVLAVTESGEAGRPIVFGSYPGGCDDKPIFTGAQPIGGWARDAGDVYVADLSAGDNAGRFPDGINQLFRDGRRRTLGRWPNSDAGDGGYSLVDASPDPRTLVDDELPAGDWSGAVVHLKTIRWLIVNRIVAGSAATALTLSEDVSCWGGCGDPDPSDPDQFGWGYFVNGHRNTLDQDGEWHYDASTNRVYLYSTSGTPSDGEVEGSVVFGDDPEFSGGILLGLFVSGQSPAHVVIENLEVGGWFGNGITTPRNLFHREPANITIRDCRIADVDGAGIKLATWVIQVDEGEDGWRGGRDLEIAGNLIERANHFGIDSYAYDSLFEGNVVRDIGLVENAGRSGLGCGFSGANCTENGDGIRLRLDKVAHSAFGNTLRYNRIERVGYCGIDVLGPANTVEMNVIDRACYSKGDCGGIRTFGRTSLALTDVHDLVFRNNIIVSTIGNTDGTSNAFRPRFGMGIYVDNFSRDVETSGNTVIGSTVEGILYQRSTGSIRNNTLYGNNAGTMGRGQVGLYRPETVIAEHTGNVLYGLQANARTLTVDDPGNVSVSDDNDFFQPWLAAHISAAGPRTLADWQAVAGQDGSSRESWFSLSPSDDPRSVIFYNAATVGATVELGHACYEDLRRDPVSGSFALAPYGSRVLVRSGPLTGAGNTLQAVKRAATSEVVFTWSGTAPAPDDYVLLADPAADGAFLDIAGSGADPSSGIRIALTAGPNTFYHVAGRELPGCVGPW